MEARASEVFVGRAPELAMLQQALDGARAGRGVTLLVAGEAGIGKTRLVAELGEWARSEGVEVLVGRSIDLVGSELPYQPVIDALRRVGGMGRVDERQPGSQLVAFENVLGALTRRATSAPLLFVLEDLHWADASTLDLVVFLAHNIGDRPIVQVGTLRADEPASAARLRRFTEGVERSGSAIVIELGPLERDELHDLVTARSDDPLSPLLVEEIAERCEGNPFFAEELVAAASLRGGELPDRLRDLLLQRVAELDPRTLDVLRLASAAGRDVPYALLRRASPVPERQLRTSLRRAVEHGVLVPKSTDRFGFRHALLAQAVYETILPGEREELHARLAEALADGDEVDPAELAPHWAAAGRPGDALLASVEAASRAEAAFGVPEALTHLERALVLWDAVPDAAELVPTDLAELCSRTAELASRAGAAPRAVELAERAITLLAEQDPLRRARLYESLGRYLHECGKTDAALSAVERAVELVPPEPPTADRANALLALARGRMLAWRFDASLPASEEALRIARAIGAPSVELWAVLELGWNLAYLGHGDEGVSHLERGLRLAAATDDPVALLQGHISLTDVLTMLGRPRQSASAGERGIGVVRPYGLDSTVLVANLTEALLAIGDWDEADRTSLGAIRSLTANFPYMPFMLRAELELGRGDFAAARAHLAAALVSLREDHGQGIYDVYVAELALWERRWMDADQAVGASLTHARSRQATQLRVWFCAKGLRAHAELAALARARRDVEATRRWLRQARRLVAIAREAAAEASAVTPNARGWVALADAEYERARQRSQPASWSRAAAVWDELQRPPNSAYCRWREAEALVAVGASRTEASVPLRLAHGVAVGIGAKPLQRELELLAQRARIDLSPPDTPAPTDLGASGHGLRLTRREAEVLDLVARGSTNREIADTLVISVKTVSVHVSHILAKLGCSNRVEAAALAHRLTAPTS